MKKGFSSILTVGITVVVMAALAAGGYYYLNKQQKDEKDSLQAQINTLEKDLATAKKTDSTSTASTSNSATSASTSTTSSSTSTATDTATANWKTYTNTANKITAKYPTSWIYDTPDTDGTVFRADADDQWKVEIDIASTAKTLQQNADAERTIKINGGYTVATSNITLDGQSAIKLTLGGEGIYGDTEILVVYNGKLYKISQGAASDSTQTNIVNSIKFTQ